MDIIYINDESDGTFPNHHPDPCVEDNLAQLKAKVKEVAMKHCAKRYVLCDSSKFSQISCVKFGEFAKTCIITTQILDESYRQCDNIIEVK